MPSGEVMTRFPVPVFDTATNRPLPYVMLYQSLSATLVRDVQVMPSGEVMTRFPVPVIDTATNKPLPNVTDRQKLSAALARDVQEVPADIISPTTSNPTPGLAVPMPNLLFVLSQNRLELSCVSIVPFENGIEPDVNAVLPVPPYVT